MLFILWCSNYLTLSLKENACQDSGLHYDGTNNIEIVESVQTLDDCADLCHANSACKYWEHDKALQTCKLKEVYEGALFVGGEDITSGISPCPTADDECKF